MRDALNYSTIPIPQDRMNSFGFNPTLDFVSSNGYYGYQRPVHEKNNEMDCTENNNVPATVMKSFDNSPQISKQEEMDVCCLTRFPSRKRVWDSGYSTDFLELKKRRQNEDKPLSLISEQPDSPPPQSRQVGVRHPTHNMPDMPRYLMGHYI